MFVLLAAFSCTKNTAIQDGAQNKYILKHIEFHLAQNDSVRTVEYKLPKTSVINGSSVTQYLYADANDDILETSAFSGDIEVLLKKQYDTIKVSVPIDIKNKIIMDDEDWPLTTDISRKKSKRNLAKKIEVPPDRTLELTVIAIMKEFLLSYKIILLDENGKEFSAFGKWRGSRLLDQREEIKVYSNIH